MELIMLDKALELLEEVNLLITNGWISIIAISKDFFVIKRIRNWKEEFIECESQDKLIAELIKLKEAIVIETTEY